MKKYSFVLLLCAMSLSAFAGTNLQLFYDFGSLGTACANQRTNRVTTTLELFYGDPWGSTFAFIDLDYNIHPNDPKNTPFQGYFEIARCLNFWKNTKAKDLSIQVEYNGGLGLYKDALGDIRGYGINHAALVVLNYCLHTEDYKNIFNLEILYKYIVDDYNKLANNVPLQFTFVWGCDDSVRLRACVSRVSSIYGVRSKASMIAKPILGPTPRSSPSCSFPNLSYGTMSGAGLSVRT